MLGAGADPMMLSKYGDDVLQTACLKGSLHIFNHLLETVFYDPNRIADAFELIGTTFLLDFHDIGSTLFFWRKALEIRYEGDFRYVEKWPVTKNIIDEDPLYNTKILLVWQLSTNQAQYYKVKGACFLSCFIED